MKNGILAIGMSVALAAGAWLGQSNGKEPAEIQAKTASTVEKDNKLAVSTVQRDNKPAASPYLIFQVMSDIHLSSERAEQKFINALADLQNAAPHSDALIINGDLGNGLPNHYAALKTIMGSSAHPASVYYTIGNHEFYKSWINRHGEWSNDTFPNGETAKASIDRFLQLTEEGRVYYDKWVKGYHFVFLGSETYRQTDPSAGDDAFLSKEQLAWLETKLAEKEQSGPAGGNNGNRVPPVFVFLHQPLPRTVSGSDIPNYRGVVQHKELTAILAKHPNVILFSGHTHWELKLPNTVVQKEFTMVNSSSVYEPWTSGDMPIPQIRGNSEALVVAVYGNRVRVRGRDIRDHRWIPEAEHNLDLHVSPR